jgi:AbrB family looped-hinge helix DNA binding protein
MAREKRSVHEVRVGPQGRIVIPAGLRQVLGFHPGTPLVALPENGTLILQRREDVLARLKARFATIPADVDLAAELLAHRRAEARREAAT